ncbi:MAG: GNAT family N-acetyltransferase [Candidatus Nanopelagicales bacterium]
MADDAVLRKKILDAAAELFAKHGYEGVGVRAVAQKAGVSQYRVRSLTGGRQDLFTAVIAERVTSDAAMRIARAVEGPRDTPPLAAIVAAGAEVYARPERSWDILELEAMTRAHRDGDLREIEAKRIQKRWDNMRSVIARARASGAVDSDVPDDALAHLSISLSVGLAMLNPVIRVGPTDATWESLIARLALSMTPAEMLLRPEHEARTHWRVFADVVDQPGGVDRFVRAMAALHGYALSMDVVGTEDGCRTLDMRMTAPAGVTAEILRATAESVGRNVFVAPGSPDDALDLSSRILGWSTELVTNPGWAPYAAMQLVSAEHADVVPATKGEDDGPEVLRLQWTAERHVLLRRAWAPFTEVERARASALLRLSAAIAAASGDRDAQGWVEQVKDGTVWLRLAYPEDAAAVTAMHKRSSDRTLYLRYVSRGDWAELQMRRLSGGHSGATVVAIGDDGSTIALGNVFPERPGEERSAEVALLVEDAHQGRGIGTALLHRLLRLAEEMGFSAVVAVVLADNASMVRMLDRTGLDWTRRFEEGVVTMRAPLPGSGSTDGAHPGARDQEAS